MKKALIITCSGYKDHEIVYPYYRLIAAGFEVVIVGDKKDERNRIYGIHGVNMPCHVLISEFSKNLDQYFNDFDLLIVPGGVDNTEKMRLIKPVVDFVKRWDEAGKCLSVICHGPQVLISAKMLKGRKISGFEAIKDDIINAGAEFVDEPSVIDGNMISSPHYDHMAPWMEQTLEVYSKINS